MKHILFLMIWVFALFAFLPDAHASNVNAIVIGNEAGVVLLMKDNELETSPKTPVTCEEVTFRHDHRQPRTVFFNTTLDDKQHDGTRLKYTFGDGTYDYGGKEMRHTYAKSGDYDVKVEVYDGYGGKRSRIDCTTTVVVSQQQSVAIQAQNTVEDRSVWQRFRDTFRRESPTQSTEPLSCQQLVVETTDYESAPATIAFRVEARRGADNAVPAGEYRIDYGDGTSDTNSSGRFSRTFQQNGNYTIQGYVRGDDGAWQGGSFCQRRINLADDGLVRSNDPSWSDYDPVPGTTKGGVDTMRTQPATGPAAYWAIGFGLSALVGLRMKFFQA
jgi:hypothetical protein